MSQPDVELFNKRAALAEDEIERLKNVVEELQAIQKDKISKLKEENDKLKYRVTIQNKAIESYKLKEYSEACTRDKMNSINESLHLLLKNAVEAAYPDLTDPPVDVSVATNPKFGDYQCNSALPLCKLLSTKERKVAPREIANKIMGCIASSPLIEKIEVAPAGFINIFLKRDFAKTNLKTVLKSQKVPPPCVIKKKVIVDFSSPNIAKEMHVGHLRSTIIGESIARILEYLGHDVLRLNHIGDWGTPFGMLIAHLQDKFPDYQTVSPPIADLQGFYKESKARFDSDEDFKKRAYACVVALQSFDPVMTKAWQMICDVSRKEFEKVYSRLDIKVIERGESFYQKYMEKIVKDLESQNFLEEDEGRKIMWGEEAGVGVPLTIVKTDGGYTYDTSDMAAIKQRIEEEAADWIIYVTDAGQAVHFQSIFSCAKRAGFLTPRIRVDHVPFGVVLGEDKKKFKTRSGDTVKLIELLDEGLNRAEQKLKEKERDKVLTVDELKVAREAVAYGCIKYADLSHNRNNEYVFSFDKMLDDKGNTAVYLLYSLTRIRSIARTANVTAEQIAAAVETTELSLEHDKEWKLAKVLLKFPDVLTRITRDWQLHQLCEFCYEIACAFSEFYDNCYCVVKNKSGEIVEVNMGRILLTEATARILEQCLYLLGLRTVSKM